MEECNRSGGQQARGDTQPFRESHNKILENWIIGMKTHRELLLDCARQRHPICLPVRRRLIDVVLFAHHDLKPTLSITDHSIHLFILTDLFSVFGRN